MYTSTQQQRTRRHEKGKQQTAFQISRKIPRSDKNKNTTVVFYEILGTRQTLKSIFPRFKRSSAPQQLLCTPLRSSNAQGGTKMENSRPPLCDWLHLPPHPRFSKTKSQLLLNCWSPPHTRVYVAMSFSRVVCTCWNYTINKR